MRKTRLDQKCRDFELTEWKLNNLIDLISSGISDAGPIALWGAITGTLGTIIGLLNFRLRYNAQKKDRPKLKCKAVFERELSSGTPRIFSNIIVRCIGRRPVTLDKIEYRFSPDSLKDRLQGTRLWHLGRYVGVQTIDQRRLGKAKSLSEGQKISLPIEKHFLAHSEKIVAVYVVDETDRKWRVQWPTGSHLKTNLQIELLDKFSGTGSRRSYELQSYRLQGRIYLYVQWKNSVSPNTSKGKYLWFKNDTEYADKIAELKNTQLPQLIDGARDTID